MLKQISHNCIQLCMELSQIHNKNLINIVFYVFFGKNINAFLFIFFYRVQPFDVKCVGKNKTNLFEFENANPLYVRQMAALRQAHRTSGSKVLFVRPHQRHLLDLNDFTRQLSTIRISNWKQKRTRDRMYLKESKYVFVK